MEHKRSDKFRIIVVTRWLDRKIEKIREILFIITDPYWIFSVVCVNLISGPIKSNSINVYLFFVKYLQPKHEFLCKLLLICSLFPVGFCFVFTNIVGNYALLGTKICDQVHMKYELIEMKTCPGRPVDETKTKAQNEQVGGKSGGWSSHENGGNSSSNSTPKKPRHSIIRSPSCPKLTGDARLTLLQWI